MADFDDLYSVFNGEGKDYEYNDEDLYGADSYDTPENGHQFDKSQPEEASSVADHRNIRSQQHQTEDFQNEEQQQQQQRRKAQQTNQQRQMIGNNRHSPAAYQQYLAAFQQNLQQQMMMNQYMMQNQYYQNMGQKHSQQRQHYNKQSSPRLDTIKKPKEATTEATDDDDRKLFVGGLNWETNEDKLRDYFSQFGEVVECSILRDPSTQRSRGFGFLTMKQSSIIDRIVRHDNHTLDGKKIDPKRAISRDEQDKAAKIFVGGISTDVTEEEFRKFFSQFGTVIDATLMMERDTGRSRGFGFITFESSEGVEKVLEQPRLSIKDKHIDVKKAMPRGKHQQMQQQLKNSQAAQQSFIPNGGGFMGNNIMYNMYPNSYQMAAYYNSMYNNNNNSNYKHSSSRHHHNKGFDDTRADSKNKYEGTSSGGGKLHTSKSQQHYRPY